MKGTATFHSPQSTHTELCRPSLRSVLFDCVALPRLMHVSLVSDAPRDTHVPMYVHAQGTFWVVENGEGVPLPAIDWGLLADQFAQV